MNIISTVLRWSQTLWCAMFARCSIKWSCLRCWCFFIYLCQTFQKFRVFLNSRNRKFPPLSLLRNLMNENECQTRRSAWRPCGGLKKEILMPYPINQRQTNHMSQKIEPIRIQESCCIYSTELGSIFSSRAARMSHELAAVHVFSMAW